MNCLSTTEQCGHSCPLPEHLKSALDKPYPVDTIRLSVPVPLDPADSNGPEFDGMDLREKRETRIRAAGGTETESQSLWSGRDDGLRVDSRFGRTSVEVSLPRFHGLQNHELERVPSRPCEPLLDHLEQVLLPRTSRLSPTPWTVHRLDIARDFPGNIRALVELYSRIRYPYARRYPTRKSDTHLVWWSRDWELLLYGKTEECASRKSASVVIKPGMCRLELRLKSARSLASLPLTEDLSSRLRVAVPKACHPSCGVHAYLHREELHLCLASWIARLQPPAGLAPRSGSLSDSGLQALREDPRKLAAYLGSVSKRTARRTKKRLEALEVELEQLDLLELAYGLSSAEWRSSMRKP